MPDGSPLFESVGLSIDDAHGDRVQFVQPGRENALSGIDRPAMKIRSTDDAVVLSEFEVNLSVRPARHDRIREGLQGNRNVVTIRLRLGDHATKQFQEEQVDFQHFTFRTIAEYAVAANPLPDR